MKIFKTSLVGTKIIFPQLTLTTFLVSMIRIQWGLRLFRVGNGNARGAIHDMYKGNVDESELNPTPQEH
jgi:hypothetical protein